VPVSELVVQIRGLQKSFDTNRVLDGVDLDVHKGEVVVVIGPSGSGKTTLLRCINLLETYDEGSVQVDGVEVGFRDSGVGVRKHRHDRELARIRADIGMVFQQFNLFPHLTVRENVMLGLRKVRGRSVPEAKQIAEQWLDRVGLGDKFASLPGQLSGGQQQRVGIARAVAMGPKVLLLDEITSALDPELVGEVLNVVQELARDGMTMIVVTHEMTFARDVATRILFMDGGRIQVEGTPRDVLSGTNHERLKAFLARIEMKHH